MNVSRALAKHDPHAVPLDQSPISCILPPDMEAEYVVEILGASVDVGNSEHEGPRRDLRLHAGRPLMARPKRFELLTPRFVVRIIFPKTLLNKQSQGVK